MTGDEGDVGAPSLPTPCLRAFQWLEPTCLFKPVDLLDLENLPGSLTDGRQLPPGSVLTQMLENTAYRLARKTFYWKIA